LLHNKQVDRPDKNKHEKELQELTDAVEKIKAERAKIQEKIDNSMADPNAKASLQETRNKLQELKQKKQSLIEEKKAMRAEMDKARGETDKLIKDKKDARSNLKFNSLADIEKEIAKLQRLQETTSMSLQEEKKLIKEVDALKASKKFVADIQAKDSAMDNVKEQRKTIQERIKAKDKEIDALSKEIDEIMAVLKEHNDKDAEKRGAIQGLFTERDDCKKQMAAKIKEKDKLRAIFREQNNAWYNYQRAVRAQKKLQFEEEKKKRDEERAEYEAKLAEEEAKKIPYEEEQVLCDYLADYLERTYLKTTTTTTDADAEKKDAATKKDDVVKVKDNPFAGMKAAGKKVEAEAEIFFGKGKGKKKRNRVGKKGDAAPAAGPFTLSVDSFEQFGLLQLTPPTSVDQVEASVKELRAKKEWYKEQPRGSVPTASEIRKANEKAAAKLRQQPAQPKQKGGGGSSAAAFSLSNDDFAPLGAGGTAAVNASWGQKPPTAAAVEEETVPELPPAEE